ncbi:MAG: polysaccharide deacetylase family protein [Solirubrobacteraceae bacterium]
MASLCVTVDFDALSIWMNWGARGARALSRGEFGARVAAPRLLDLFDRLDARTTWFVPGHTAETFPEITREVSRCGHEIANHGYHHESFVEFTTEQGREILEVSNDALERITGERPRGFRHPTGDLPDTLLQTLLDLEFAYDSSLAADDFHPYWAPGPWTHPEGFGPSVRGLPLDLVEIPHSFVLNDFHHFEFSYGNPELSGRDSPGAVEEIWRAQWAYMRDAAPDGVFNLVLHPQSIGQGLRIAMLERFLRDCAAEPGVRMCALEDVAAEFRLTHQGDA